MVVLSWTFNRFFCSEYYFVCAVSPLSRSLPSQLWNDDVCLGSCWTRLCNSCRDIGKSHIFTLANYSIWPKFFVKRHTALECWASALFMQRWPVFFRQTLHEETWKAKYSKFSDTSKTLWIFRQSEQVRASSIQRNAFLKQGIIANWKCVVSSHGFEKIWQHFRNDLVIFCVTENDLSLWFVMPVHKEEQSYNKSFLKITIAYNYKSKDKLLKVNVY